MPNEDTVAGPSTQTFIGRFKIPASPPLKAAKYRLKKRMKL